MNWVIRRDGTLRWIGTLAVWIAVGVSLGWYYTFTYYGRTGIPMPTLESCAALLLYYFSVSNVDTEIQAIHWVLVFPIAGVLSPLSLHLTARVLKLAPPALDKFSFALACAAIPMALPGPFMAWAAGYTDAGFDASLMIDVALRRATQPPWAWLSPLYLGLGVASLGLQVRVYRAAYAIPLRRALVHFPASGIVLTVLAGVIGTLISFPIRALE